MPSCLIKGCVTGNGGDIRTPPGVQRHTIPSMGENRDKWLEQIKRYENSKLWPESCTSEL